VARGWQGIIKDSQHLTALPDMFKFKHIYDTLVMILSNNFRPLRSEGAADEARAYADACRLLGAFEAAAISRRTA
jgi:hypothetical protein